METAASQYRTDQSRYRALQRRLYLEWGYAIAALDDQSRGELLDNLNHVVLKLRLDLRDAGFGAVGVRGAAGITYAYVEGRVARLVLPLYNVYERALQHSPFEDRWGTFLIGHGVRP